MRQCLSVLSCYALCNRMVQDFLVPLFDLRAFALMLDILKDFCGKCVWLYYIAWISFVCASFQTLLCSIAACIGKLQVVEVSD